MGSLARLAKFLAPYRWRVAAALLALVAAAGCVLALGQGLKYVVDAGFGSGEPRLLNGALAAAVAVAVTLSVATYFRFYLMMSTGERVVTDLRRAVFDHLLALSPGYFETARTGELVSRLASDTTVVQQVIGYGLSMFVRNLLMMTGAAAMLFFTSWKLAALVLVGVPATLVPILLLGRRVRQLSRASQDRVADVSAHVDESMHEVRTVQAYGHEDADREIFARHAEAAYAAADASIGQKAALIAAVMLIAFCAVGVILWVGGHDVLAGRLTAGELSAFVFYAGIVATGAGTVSEVWGEIQRAAGATERLFELLDARPAILAPAVPQPAPAAPRALEFDAVTFAYAGRPDAPALERFALRIAAGEHVALVGPSGAGKSTVLALLLRFYDPQAGALRIDGVDLRDMEPRALRRAGGRAAAVRVEDMGGKSAHDASSFSSRMRVMLACSSAAMRSSSSGGLSSRARSNSNISAALFPVAHTRKMKPNRRSYSALPSASPCSTASSAPLTPPCSCEDQLAVAANFARSWDTSPMRG
jgi:ATP-binding cassette subfamily B protein